MDSQNRDRCSVKQSAPDETSEGKHKKLKISYTRDFLLSLAGLDECKKLPSGFDLSIFSEFDDPDSGISEHQRVAYNQSLHSSKGSGYASSQFSRISDPGRQNVKQYRSPWQKLQYYGDFGNVAFPRAYGGVSGNFAPPAQGNGYYHQNRYKEPYHPSCLLKALPDPMKENIDLYNDETFGSLEYLDHETAEEEKRRVSFELMRKEQEKAIREQRKPNVDERKEDLDPENDTPFEDSGNDKDLVNKSNESEEFLVLPASTKDSVKVSLCASRPAIPPGFTNRILEKNLGTKSLAHFTLSEHDDGKADNRGNSLLHSSKFATLFSEEEKKLAVTWSSNAKGGPIMSGVSNEEVIDHNHPNLTAEINQLTCKLPTPTSAFAMEGISEQLGICNKPFATPGVLTCGDLEQFVLFKNKGNNSTQKHSVKGWSPYAKNKRPNAANNNDASRHLISLLQKEVSLNDLTVAASKIFHPNVDEFSRYPGTNSEDMMSSVFAKLHEFNLTEGTKTGHDNAQAKIWSNCQTEQDSTLRSIICSDDNDDSTVEICLPEEDALFTVDDPIVPQRSMFMTPWNSIGADFSTPADIAENIALNVVLGDERSTVPGLEGSPFLQGSNGQMGSESPYHNLHGRQFYSQLQHSQMDPQWPSKYPLDSPQLSSHIRSMDWKTYNNPPHSPHHNPEDVHFLPLTYHPAEPTRFDHPVHNSLLQQRHIPEGFPPHQHSEWPSRGPLHSPINQSKVNPIQRFPQHHQQPSYGSFGMANPAPADDGKGNSAAFNWPIEMELREKPRYPYAVDKTFKIPLGVDLRANQMHPFAMGPTFNIPMETEHSSKEMHPFAVDATLNTPINMERGRRGRQILPRTPRGHGQGTFNEHFDMGFWNAQ